MPALPVQLGNYRIVGRIGRGGMGDVYLAEQAHIGRKVALKVLPRDLAEDPVGLARFRREAHVLGQVSHPHICAVIDMGETDGTFYYVMEFLDGDDLARVLRDQRITFDRAADIARQIAEALHSAHSRGIVHRDIKPQNVIVTRSDRPRGGNGPRAGTTPRAEGAGADDAPAGARAGKPPVPPQDGPSPAPGAATPDATTVRHGGALTSGLHPDSSPRGTGGQAARATPPGGHEARATPPGGPAARATPPGGHEARATPPSGPAARATPDSDRHPVPDYYDHVYVIDFGLAKEAGTQTLTTSGEVMGTPAYMSPEQAAGKTSLVGPHTDVYAVGAILYEMLTLRPPFDAPDFAPLIAKIQLEDPIPPRRLNPQVPVDLETIAMRCLEKDPARRYASAEALADDLRRTLADEPILARPTGFLERFRRRVRRNPLAAGAIASAAALLLALGALLFGPARLSVDSDPSGARVFLNEEDTGRVTPVEGMAVWPPGFRQIGLRRDGYVPAQQGLRLGALSRESVSIPLRHETGTLNVTTNVDQATLRARLREGGAEHEFALPREGIELDTGAWNLVIEKENTFPCSRLVEIGREAAVDLHATLSPMLFWKYNAAVMLETSPVVADLDGDAIPEIVCGLDVGVLIVLRPGTIGEVWRFETVDEVKSCPAVADLDGDGRPEVLSQSSAALHAIGGDGKERWSAPIAGSYLNRPAAADLNGDGIRDVIALEQEGAISAFSGRDGAPLWRFSAGPKFWSIPALADLDRDAVPDVVAISTESNLYAVSGRAGTLLWKVPLPAKSGFNASPVLGKMDADDVPDAVVGDWAGRVHAFSGVDGREIWRYQTGKHIPSTAELVDLNGDGRDDVVIGSGDNFVYALDPSRLSGPEADGSRAPALLWKHETDYEVWGRVSSCRVDGDDIPDLLVGSDDACVHCLSGRDGGLLWKFRTGNQIISGIEVADLDGDGVAEAVFTSKDGVIYAVSVQPGRLEWANRREGRVSFFELLDAGPGRAPAILSGSDSGPFVCFAGEDGRRMWRQGRAGHHFGVIGWNQSVRPDRGSVCGVTSYALQEMSLTTGEVLWKYPVPTGAFWAGAALDLNRDGRGDFLLGEEAPGPGATPIGPLAQKADPRAVEGCSAVSAVARRSAGPLWRICLEGVATCHSLTDRNGDGVPDVLVESKSVLYTLDGARGTLLHEREVDPDISWWQGFVCPAPGGEFRLVGLGNDGHVHAKGVREAAADWVSEGDDYSAYYPWPCDIDGDGVCDLVAENWRTRLDAISSANGKTLWKVGLPLSVSFDIVGWGPDMDGDGRHDVAAVTISGQVFCYSGADGKPLGRFSLPYEFAVAEVRETDGFTVGTRPLLLLGLSDGRVLSMDARPRPPLGVIWSLGDGAGPGRK